MYARVARWEGADGDAMRRAAERIKSQAGGRPPEGVPATGLLLLIDPDNGQGMGITLFETEADLQKGHETLNSMSPPDDGFGRRSTVEMYEVAVEIRA